MDQDLEVGRRQAELVEHKPAVGLADALGAPVDERGNPAGRAHPGPTGGTLELEIQPGSVASEAEGRIPDSDGSPEGQRTKAVGHGARR